MTAKDDVRQAFDDAQERIRKRMPPPGVMRSDRDPDPTTLIINENFAAVNEALEKLAERIDAIEGQSSTPQTGE